MSFCHFFIDKNDLKDYLEENRSGIGSKTTAEKVSKLGLRIENLVQSEKGKFSDFFSLKCECKIHCANLTGLLDLSFGSTVCLHTSTTFFVSMFQDSKEICQDQVPWCGYLAKIACSKHDEIRRKCCKTCSK